MRLTVIIPTALQGEANALYPNTFTRPVYNLDESQYGYIANWENTSEAVSLQSALEGIGAVCYLDTEVEQVLAINGLILMDEGE